MRTLRICLLVSDDPDDHQLLFEAIKEISKNIILAIVLQGDDLLQMLNEDKLKPDFIVLDTATDNISDDLISKLAASEKLENIRTIIYTDDTGLANYPGNIVLSKRLTYSDMRSKLKTLLLTAPEREV